MNRILFLFFLRLLFAHSQPAKKTDAIRQRININREWKFLLGNEKGAERPTYNDKAWSNVHLPHNFSIPYFQSAQGATAGIESTSVFLTTTPESVK